MPWSLSFRTLAAGLGCCVLGAAGYVVWVRAPADKPSIPANGQIHHEHGAVFLDFSKRHQWLLQHEFVFRNPYSQPLALELERVSCGCARCDIVTPVVAPGELGRVRVAVTVAYERKRRTEVATIRTGAAAQPRLSLILTADVYPRITVEPFHRNVRQTFSGDAPPPLELKIVLAAEDTGGPSEKLHVSTFPGLIAQLGQPHSVRSNGLVQTLLPVTLKVDEHQRFNAGEMLKGTVIWRHEGAEIDTEVILQRAAVITASPAPLFLNSSSTQPVSQPLQVQCDIPFQILRTRVSDERLLVEQVASDAPNCHNFKVAFASTSGANEEKTSRHLIVLETDLKQQPTVTVDIWVLE